MISLGESLAAGYDFQDKAHRAKRKEFNWGRPQFTRWKKLQAEMSKKEAAYAAET